ncbi:MAG: hypothetical protein M1814_005724 [Vezdaea aestivalis]|nr:MAG: hypothetical protein M1814_005724 [Vezdaea aestivalis]
MEKSPEISSIQPRQPPRIIDIKSQSDPITFRLGAAPSAELVKRKSQASRADDTKETLPTRYGVDVREAEADFAILRRELSTFSQQSLRTRRGLTQRQSGQNRTFNSQDVEKLEMSSASDDEPLFDLEDALRGVRPYQQGKKIGVFWEQLSIHGHGGKRRTIETFPDAFVSFFNIFALAKRLLPVSKSTESIPILRNFCGLVHPGEMVLVLGRPGSGCSTFLKAVANQRSSFDRIDGNIQFGPYDAQEFSKRFPGEAVYNQEDDEHHPTLTVEQTLNFAMDTKTSKEPLGMPRNLYKKKVVDLLLKMFNMQHCAHTVVGNAFIRGISGGERKRTSIAEMMITSANVCAWDNSTRGLDSSTALDYAKSLRIMTNIYKTATFVSLYQASESMYRQFDKVVVIDSGRLCYFGPASGARVYFETLGFSEKPRQTTPDYLTACTDPFERDIKQGAKGVPQSAEALEQAFDKSIYSQMLKDEIKAYKAALSNSIEVVADFEVAVQSTKRQHTSQKSVYSVPFYTQTWALVKRQYLIKLQDKFSLSVSWITSITIAIILGTVWLRLPQTSSGAFTRGGLLFLALLFNAFQAFAELGLTMVGRSIVTKHVGYTFYRPSALAVAQIFIDLLFGSVQIIAFSIIVYFMCGLVLDASAFFFFIFVNILGYLAMTLFFRAVASLCPDLDYAIKLAAIMITFLVITSGYLIQSDSQPVWMRWIFYVNPLGLGFASLMENEFSRINLTCMPESLVPFGPTYSQSKYQVCTLPGSSPGSIQVSGSDYIKAAFDYEYSDIWRNLGVIFSTIIVFMAANLTFGEFINHGTTGRTLTSFAKSNSERRRLNAVLTERKQKRLNDKEALTTNVDLAISSTSVLTWESLSYDVPCARGNLRLLRDVFGYVKPGELTALMGASGAGKTTLMDVLAQRKNIGTISGQILIDGVAPGAAFQRGTSYAEQLDVHEGTQTVREALQFSADLRQSYGTSREEKYAYVEEVIALLEMEDVADAVIGGSHVGLSPEQRKRATIGVELAAKPELLLFLDEPTSGLDSQSAFNIVRFLKKLSAAGQAILCTIHQPNSTLFELFDRLLLLQKGGQCVYFGDIGPDAKYLRSYFERYGAVCPPTANPAEWILDTIGAGQAGNLEKHNWASIWTASEEFKATKRSIDSIKRQRPTSQTQSAKQMEYASPLCHQIRVVSSRTNLAFWRTPSYGFTRLFNHVVIALVTGLAFIDLDASRASLQYRVFIIFQATILPALILAQVEPKYELSRIIFYRESASKAYGQFAFVISMVIAEIPYSVICTAGFFLPLYYIPRFSFAAERAGYQFLMILVTELFSVTLAQMVSALTPSSFIAALVNPFIIVTFALFCGVTVPKPQIPKFWRSWLYHLVPFTRLIGGMLVTELHDLPVVCNSKEYNSFSAPEGQLCGEYMAQYFKDGGRGYILDNTTQLCKYCAFKVGDQFYEPLGLTYDHRWRDLVILSAFIGSNLIVLFFASRYLNFNRR